jgi:lauroyl/myristoyl acyltransferase
MANDVRKSDGPSGEIAFTARRTKDPIKPRLIHRTDIEAVLRLAAYGAGIRLLPETRWEGFRQTVPQKKSRSLRQRVAAGLLAYFGVTKTAAEIDAIAGQFLTVLSRRLMLTACEAKANWSPSLDLRDADRLQQALDRGRGVILWCDAFAGQSLLGKRMLHAAGYRAAQVSLGEHGFSKTGFGQRWINREQQRQELRYADRLEFARGQEAALARRVQRVLRAGGLVTITNNVAAASRIVTMPFGADGQLVVAAGPLRIAQSCGASLLPFAVIEDQPFRRYVGYIGEDLLRETRVSGAVSEPLTTALLAYRDWIAALVEHHPAQWLRWETVARSGVIEV